jgi:hypothetical protein
MPIDLKALRSSIAAKPLVAAKPPEEVVADSDHIPLGVSGLLAASSKLLHINRGLTETDDRDSYAFKTILRNHNHLEERINLDAGKVRQKLMWRIMRDNSLKGVVPGALDNYTNGFLIGTSDEPNQLSAPLEETNPMHLLENAHRVTMMGDGGIGSDDQVTGDAQAINGSQFGFVCPISGPECHDSETEVLTKRGWVKWPEVRDDEFFACRLDGRLQFLRAERVIRSPYDGEMIGVDGKNVGLLVTPNHRILAASPDLRQGSGKYRSQRKGYTWRMDTAVDMFGKNRLLDTGHLPYFGNDISHFELPKVAHKSNTQKTFGPIVMDDWTEFMGWYLGEGNLHYDARYTRVGKIQISQCPDYHPYYHKRIMDLLDRLPFSSANPECDPRAFITCSVQLGEYMRQFGKSPDRFIPDDLQHVSISARTRMFEALIFGEARKRLNSDGSIGKKIGFVSTSKNLADDFERLAIGLGYPTSRGVEKDSRPHVKTTNYRVSILFSRHRNTKSYQRNFWYKTDYVGIVYCATVPGGLLYTRKGHCSSGVWTGNSGRAGVDVRLANGVHISDSGKIYQKFRNARTKEVEWVDAATMRKKVLAMPE